MIRENVTFLKKQNSRIENNFCYELDTVISSNLFGLDEYIKQYLLQPDLPYISFIKIGLRYYITPELIVQLNELKEYLNIPSYEVFYKCYTRF